MPRKKKEVKPVAEKKEVNIGWRVELAVKSRERRNASKIMNKITKTLKGAEESHEISFACAIAGHSSRGATSDCSAGCVNREFRDFPRRENTHNKSA